jgi:hypothetical protein
MAEDFAKMKEIEVEAEEENADDNDIEDEHDNDQEEVERGEEGEVLHADRIFLLMRQEYR